MALRPADPCYAWAPVNGQVRELLDLVIRWVHLIAGIMWIGNSLLFNWLDRNLEKPKDAPPGYEGKIWLLHSGGFYDVEKKLLQPSQLPERLHWFKWQNFATWASGICLLFVVYYSGGGALLVDPSVSKIGVPIAMVIGVGAIVASWLFYDFVWISPLSKRPAIASALCFLYVGALAFGLTHVLSGRAAYIHVGVVLGTIMTGNVWFVIMPSQRELVAATKEGREQDPKIGKRAKLRSIHNNYMTFPLLFIMVSNHFPSTYGSKLNWLVLGVIAVGGATVRHLLNIRFQYKRWLPMTSGVIAVTVTALYVLTRPEVRPSAPVTAEAPKVSFHTVRGVIHQRCQPCHSAHPTDSVWKVAPAGVMFDSPAQIRRMAPRIKERAVVSRTMPLQNKTGITQAERDMIGDWIDQGASIQ